VVYAAEASDVETVIIDGQVVMRDRQLLTLDEQTIINQAQDEARQLAKIVEASKRQTSDDHG